MSLRQSTPIPPSRTPSQHQAHSKYKHLLTFRIRRCSHSNKTCAPIANPPKSAQLEGTHYHSAYLHPRPCSSVGMRRGTDTQTAVTTIHFASATPHVNCNDCWHKKRIEMVWIVSRLSLFRCKYSLTWTRAQRTSRLMPNLSRLLFSRISCASPISVLIPSTDGRCQSNESGPQNKAAEIPNCADGWRGLPR